MWRRFRDRVIDEGASAICQSWSSIDRETLEPGPFLIAAAARRAPGFSEYAAIWTGSSDGSWRCGCGVRPGTSSQRSVIPSTSSQIRYVATRVGVELVTGRWQAGWKFAAARHSSHRLQRPGRRRLIGLYRRPDYPATWPGSPACPTASRARFPLGVA